MVNCEYCFKFHHPEISPTCPFCQDYSFRENILCDLLRSGKDRNELECFSFQPNLSVIGAADQTHKLAGKDHEPITLSARQKWLKSYAIQQWEFDSDQIFCTLNYHVCLIAKNRNCIFRQMAEHASELSDILSHAGEQFKGKVNVLYLGTDHIHLHIDSPPDYSAHEVVQKTMVFFESAVKNEFPELVDHKSSLFEDAYFIESIGD